MAVPFLDANRLRQRYNLLGGIRQAKVQTHRAGLTAADRSPYLEAAKAALQSKGIPLVPGKPIGSPSPPTPTYKPLPVTTGVTGGETTVGGGSALQPPETVGGTLSQRRRRAGGLAEQRRLQNR